MADGKIYITITDEPIQQNVNEVSGGGSNNSLPKAKTQDGVGVAGHYFLNIMESEVKAMVNYSLGNIGNFTGNYITQNNVNSALRIGGKLIGLGTSIAAGAAMGGPVGAVAAGIAYTAGEITNFALQEKSNNFAYKKQNREIDILRQMSGLDTLTNGSRN